MLPRCGCGAAADQSGQWERNLLPNSLGGPALLSHCTTPHDPDHSPTWAAGRGQQGVLSLLHSWKASQPNAVKSGWVQCLDQSTKYQYQKKASLTQLSYSILPHIGWPALGCVLVAGWVDLPRVAWLGGNTTAQLADCHSGFLPAVSHLPTLPRLHHSRAPSLVLS